MIQLYTHFLKDLKDLSPRGGSTWLADGRGSAAPFSERYLLLITETCCHTHFYDEFRRKTTHFWLFLANFWIAHPCLWTTCRKWDPCFENFGPKPTHTGGIYPDPQHAMYPLRDLSPILSTVICYLRLRYSYCSEKAGIVFISTVCSLAMKNQRTK